MRAGKAHIYKTHAQNFTPVFLDNTESLPHSLLINQIHTNFRKKSELTEETLRSWQQRRRQNEEKGRSDRRGRNTQCLNQGEQKY